MIDPIYIVDPAYKKNMVSIDSYVKEEVNKRIEEDSTGLYGNLIEDNIDIADGHNEIYGVPFVLDYGVVLYNKNLAPTILPTTWEELEDWSRNTEIDKNNIISKYTKYGAQLLEYREYFYNFVETTANYNDNDNFSLHGEEAKGAVDIISRLFNNDVLNEKAWNQDSLLMKTSFCKEDVVFMRTWASFENFIRQSCENLNFDKTRVFKSSSKIGETKTVARSVALAMSQLVSEDKRETVAGIIKFLTSKEFISQLMNDPLYKGIPPYYDLIASDQGGYCQHGNDCIFEDSVIKSIIANPISRFRKNNDKGHFHSILYDSYENIKKTLQE